MGSNTLNKIGGPGSFVAAAFIGPGTVTLCSIAGVNYGLDLLWALVFSIFATIVLQEMSMRMGIISQKGLSEIIRLEVINPIVRTGIIVLILAAIVIGNTAYEAGNISGGSIGMALLISDMGFQTTFGSFQVLPLILGAIAFALLYIGSYKILQRILLILVILMSVSFLTVAIMTRPSIIDILRGIFGFNVPKGSLVSIIGLIGTTVVPYNLFLHASLAKGKWKSAMDLPNAKKDTFMSIIIGGLVSMCIVVAASAINLTKISSGADLAESLAPVFGDFSKYVLAIGLFAAGITSAITAPLAAAYVTSGCLGWKSDISSPRFKWVSGSVLLLGVILSTTNVKPLTIIQFAQFTNGLVLPIIALFLLWVVNKSSVLKAYKNTSLQNILGILVVLVTILLGVKSIISVFSR